MAEKPVYKSDDIDTQLCGAIKSLKITQGEQTSPIVEYLDVTGGQILVLKKDAVVYLHGIVSISIIAGKVDLFGYIPAIGKVYVVNSPRYTPHLYIKNITLHKNKDEIEDAAFLKTGLKQEDLNRVKETWTPFDAVLLCKRLDVEKIDVVDNHFGLNLFPCNKNGFIFQEEVGKWDVVTGTSRWNELVSNIEKPDGNFDKIFVIGARKTGKGLLSRYLINKFLTKYDKVLMIDLDPAQSEFTVSGSISACILSEPLFGPNYMHPKSAEYSVFVGSVDLRTSYQYYLKCVEKLVGYCNNVPNMPVIIQFNGFTNDIAFNIISSIICISKPNRIAELYSNIKHYNFQIAVNIENIEQHKKYTNHMSVAPFSLYRFESINNESAPIIDSKVLRIMRLVIYFYDAVPVDREFRISTMKKTENKANVRLGQLLAICKETDVNDIYQCFGWGAINCMKDGNFTLLTPFKFAEDENYVFVLPEYLVFAPKRQFRSQTYPQLFSAVYDDDGFQWYSRNVAYQKRRY